MTYDEKVAWLRRYQDSLKDQYVLELEVQRLTSEAQRVTPLLSGMPSGGADTSKLPRAVEKMLETKERLQTKIEHCESLRKEVASIISRVTPARDRNLLYRRYIIGQRWERIAADDDKDLRWVFRLHRAAIENLTIESH